MRYDIATRVEHAKLYFVPITRNAMDDGCVDFVDHLVDSYLPLAEEFGDGELLEVFGGAREWVSKSREHERIHGRGSLRKPREPSKKTTEKFYKLIEITA